MAAFMATVADMWSLYEEAYLIEIIGAPMPRRGKAKLKGDVFDIAVFSLGGGSKQFMLFGEGSSKVRVGDMVKIELID